MSTLLKLLDEMMDAASERTLSKEEVARKMDELSKKSLSKYKLSPEGNGHDKPLLNRNEKWQERWLPSDHFVLMDVPVSKIDQPVQPRNVKIVKDKIKQKDPNPIFIDRNIQRGTKDPRKKRLEKPATYVVDGKHRAEAARRTGKKSIPAWVGTQAVPLLQRQKKGVWWSDPGMKELQ